MSRTLSLQTYAVVTLDASGNGTVQIGPVIPGVTWQVTQVACYTTSVQNNPQFNLYLGDALPSNTLGGTYSGNNDANTGLAITLRPGQYFTGQWAGGDAGAEATFTVIGTQLVP
jgi:hypothetical protein